VPIPVDSDPCPCGTGRYFNACCGPLLAGAPAATAEALMRSRYTAYVLLDAAYLERTHCPPAAARPADTPEIGAGTAPDPALHWLDLRILRTERGGPGDRDGVVEFIARYKHRGRAGRLHEVSRFVRAGAGWCYVDGDQPTPEPTAPTRRRRR
jgi:SEC-C motif-containing protein